LITSNCGSLIVLIINKSTNSNVYTFITLVQIKNKPQ
jgi:hypothetical protein